MIVPKKRTALLVNRLMVALKKAMEQDEKEDQLKRANSLNMFSRSNKDYSLLSKDLRQMDLQRRGHGDVTQQKGRIYWRCYFNAVTCF
ncbi:hypothetical protein NQ317_006487 [Molorchus minor]|uniref:Uncharacterized protein n=1 Tax=Molorchus minor TaxID=1323400 RepID=A0ABQ9J981_9CUCU|nr:hypothetical protein NQ317_006487 [Molorchus minor]